MRCVALRERSFLLALIMTNVPSSMNVRLNGWGTQGGTQGGTQIEDLSTWIETQIRTNPNITTESLSKMAGVSVRTIKRRIADMPNIRFVGSGYSGHWEIIPTDQ